MNNENKILYFGYGANADSKRIEQIIGEKPIKKCGAIIANYKLCIQTLHQIPETAREDLRSVWGDDFLSYTLSPGKGLVSGIVWELNKETFKKMEEWETIGNWRKFINIEIFTYDGSKIQAQTDIISSEDQELFGCVDSLAYPFQLNEDLKANFLTSNYEEEKKTIALINKIRQEIKT